MTLRIGIDTGGTFTDLVLLDESSGRLAFHKIPSTPHDPGEALVKGVLALLDKASRRGEPVALLVHGTTVATNAVLQRQGARTALVTTAGFRDVLQIQRQDRPEMYSLRARRARPLIPRALRLEVEERIRHDGSVQTPLCEEQLEAVVEQLERSGAEAVAVGLLHSYANADHERRIGRALRKRLPDVSVCLAHELVQEHGEYERLSTCAMNAFVQPAMQRYLDRLDGGLRRAGIAAPLLVMKSNGGVMAARTAGRQCVHTILSGPAGGVVEGVSISEALPHKNVIAADMGGTSFDVALIREGSVPLARNAAMAGLAIQVPMLDIHTVGAGGGSIAWIDAGGALRVGPESAGAVPGPACYGSGGTRPTVTDANLVLGRLAPHSLLEGALPLDEAAAAVAVGQLAAPLGLSLHEAAEGIVRIAVATMTAAIRKVSVERGHDPRQFCLCAFGGAGPLHAALLAAELGIRQTVIPLAPGVTSAVGLLRSRLREDRVRTIVAPLASVEPARLESIFDELEHQAGAELAEAIGERPTRCTRTLGLRYLGQGYDLPIPLADGQFDAAALAAAFHAEHGRSYGFAREEEPIELVNVWTSLEVDLGGFRRAAPTAQPPKAAAAPLGTRPVVFDGAAVSTPIYRRADLTDGMRLTGPAIVAQLDTTTVLWPGQSLVVDCEGQLLLGPISSKRGYPS